MRTESTSLLPSRSRRASRWLAALLAAGLLPLAAEPLAIPIEDNDTVQLQANGQNATIRLGLSRAPASNPNASLKAANRDNYTFWSAPLSRQGNAWTASVDRAGLEAILMAGRLVAEFPGAAPNNEALHLVVPSDRINEVIEPAAAMVGQEPLFFEPPQPPEKPDVPSTDVERVRAESFAMTARRWDKEIAAHLHKYQAAQSRAYAFFLDLRTSGRLSWPAEVLNRLDQAYRNLEQRLAEIEKTRADWRSTAQQFVQQWNQTHADQPPVELKFDEPAAVS